MSVRFLLSFSFVLLLATDAKATQIHFHCQEITVLATTTDTNFSFQTTITSAEQFEQFNSVLPSAPANTKNSQVVLPQPCDAQIVIVSPKTTSLVLSSVLIRGPPVSVS